MITAGRRSPPTRRGAECAHCSRPVVAECGHDRACGGDRGWRSDGADAGGRAGAGGSRCRHRRATREPGCSTDRGPGVFTPAPSRCSISAASPSDSSSAGTGRPRSWGSPGASLDISDFPTRHNYVLALWQSHFEPILADWVESSGCRSFAVARWSASPRTTPASTSSCPTRRRSEPSTSSAATEDAAWSARRPASTSRAGTPPTSWMIAEVEMDEQPELGMRPRGRWHRSREPGRGRRAIPGRARRAAGRTHRRAHPAGPQRGARRRLRDATSACTAPTGSPGSPT